MFADGELGSLVFILCTWSVVNLIQNCEGLARRHSGRAPMRSVPPCGSGWVSCMDEPTEEPTRYHMVVLTSRDRGLDKTARMQSPKTKDQTYKSSLTFSVGRPSTARSPRSMMGR